MLLGDIVVALQSAMMHAHKRCWSRQRIQRKVVATASEAEKHFSEIATDLAVPEKRDDLGLWMLVRGSGVGAGYARQCALRGN